MVVLINGSEQAGIAYMNWSIDSPDWKYRDAAKTIEHINRNAYNGGILLMHDIHEEISSNKLLNTYNKKVT